MSLRVGNSILAGSPIDKTDLNLANSPYTTNRILEIPQNIKLELINGTLTLKAGSKVCVPNGSSFDFITINSDLSVTPGNNGKNFVIAYNTNTTPAIINVLSDYCYSGSTAPTSGTVFFWYDTTNNVVKYNSSGSTTSPNWQTSSGYSFPICLGTTASGSGMTSVDKIFNGFGYIGSTMFAFPSVKLEQADGKNADGSNKTLIQTISSVMIYTFPSTANNGMYDIYYHKTSSNHFVVRDYGKLYYNASTNLIDDLDYPGEVRGIILGTCSTDSNHRITSCQFASVDSVSNNNMSNISNAGKSFISGMGLPSSKTEQWTLSVSNSEYIAPANGYFSVYAVPSQGTYMYLKNSDGTIGDALISTGTIEAILTVPVLKGSSVIYTYNGTFYNNLNRIYFTYAEGEN